MFSGFHEFLKATYEYTAKQAEQRAERQRLIDSCEVLYKTMKINDSKNAYTPEELVKRQQREQEIQTTVYKLKQDQYKNRIPFSPGAEFT
ncbi:MAG: hypothetical protein K0Q57_181 [Gammaproteobacteria bacterium]|jgi:hypothetical protein|nr:hypothetical protein [Gammaproteobacteria bacterium]